MPGFSHDCKSKQRVQPLSRNIPRSNSHSCLYELCTFHYLKSQSKKHLKLVLHISSSILCSEWHVTSEFELKMLSWWWIVVVRRKKLKCNQTSLISIFLDNNGLEKILSAMSTLSYISYIMEVKFWMAARRGPQGYHVFSVFSIIKVRLLDAYNSVFVWKFTRL